MTQAEAIRRYLVKNVSTHPHDIVAVASSHFDVSRMTIHRHLETLITQGKIIKTGTTRNISYHLASDKNKTITLSISPELSEFDIWQHYFQQDFTTAKDNIVNICSYGFTEMVNNVLDHSRGKNITITSEWKKNIIIFVIEDDGVGIFNKIKTAFNYKTLQEAVFQLSKGKLTTDIQNHTGQGVFFTSRAFDYFAIEANHMKYYRDNLENDWFLESKSERAKGTKVTLEIDIHSTRDLISIFKLYQHPDTLEFTTTEIIVELAKLHGERYISRSQAKRITEGLEKFEHIILDFAHVTTVGQGFVDEIFRVYQNKYPEKRIEYRHANSDVAFMIKRGLATAKSIATKLSYPPHQKHRDNNK